MAWKLDPESGSWSHNSGDGGSSKSNNNTVNNKAPAGSAGETKALVDGLGKTNSKETSDVDGSGTCIGNTRVKKYGKGLVTGIGKAFEGLYYFSQVKHKINGSGFVTEFSVKARYEDIGAKEKKSSGTSSGSGSSSSSSGSSGSSSKSNSSKSPSSGGYKYKLDPETGTYTRVPK